MKNLMILGVLCAVGCAAAKAAPVPGESASSIALTYAVMRSESPTPGPAPLPETKCDGTGWITHGDGHRTECPGCSACNKREPQPLIQPAVYERITKVSRLQCADGSCAAPTVKESLTVDCECVQATGSCACAPTKRTTTSGSCASGSCGSSAGESRGPVRKFIKARPVRRLFGRLFRR